MTSSKRTPPHRKKTITNKKLQPAVKRTVSKKTTTKHHPAPARKKPPTPTPPVKNPYSYVNIIHDLRAAYGTAGTQITILNVPWEKRMEAKVLGADYNNRIKAYIYSGEQIPEQLKPYISEDYSYHRWLEDELNKKIKPAQKLEGGLFTPREYQTEGIQAIKKAAEKGWRGFIVADETGLGKTITGLLGVNEAMKHRMNSKRKARVLILCPLSAIPHWRNTIRRLNVPNLRILIANWEQYKTFLEEPSSVDDVKKRSTKTAHTLKNGVPFIKWDAIIADEAHKIKNYTSDRTKAFNSFAEYATPADKAPFVVWMSATIAQNPVEAGYIAPLIGQAVNQPLTMRNWGSWLEKNGFHVSHSKTGWSWVKPTNKMSPAEKQKIREQQTEDVKKLAKILFAPAAPSIRRKPEDLKGWPPVQYIPFPIQLSPDLYKNYTKTWTDFRKEYHLKYKGNNPKSILEQYLRFAQKASLLRTQGTVNETIEMLEQGYQVAVSCRFLETLDQIRAGLKQKNITVSEVSGRSFIDSETERLKFQKGVNKVILFTVEEAVSFHANETLPDGTKATPFPRNMIIHDLRYSAISMKQIAGRTHRDGQASNTYFTYAENTVEEKVLNIMINKMKNMSLLSGEDESDELTQILDNLSF